MQNTEKFCLPTDAIIFDCTVMRRLTTGIRSEKCVVRQFHHCANVTECTYTNLDSTDYYTPTCVT